MAGSRVTEERRREIGRRIYEAREDKALSQAELAVRVGITHSTVSRWETGHRMPTHRVMRRLAHILDKPIPYLRASDWDQEELNGGDHRHDQ